MIPCVHFFSFLFFFFTNSLSTQTHRYIGTFMHAIFRSQVVKTCLVRWCWYYSSEILAIRWIHLLTHPPTNRISFTPYLNSWVHWLPGLSNCKSCCHSQQLFLPQTLFSPNSVNSPYRVTPKPLSSLLSSVLKIYPLAGFMCDFWAFICMPWKSIFMQGWEEVISMGTGNML